MSDRYSFLPGPGAGLEIARTEGSFLIMPDGRRILDAAGGAICASIGHGRAEVADAVADSMREMTYVVPPVATPQRTALVTRLQDHWLPPGIERCVFSCGGSDSVDLALRIVRQHFVSKGEPQRHKIIGRALSYHGTTVSTLDIGGHTKRKDAYAPMMQAPPKAPACYSLRCELCQRDCTLACADAFEAAIAEAGPDEVAAIIIEPIGGSTGGALVPPDGYLSRVAEIARRHGALLIADEVMTGFGRTGAKFAVDHWDVVPDLLVSGKGLAAGYAPIGGVYATNAVVEPIAAAGDELMFYTFSAHPAACAAADKVLEILQREHLVERAARVGEKLSERLHAAFDDHPNVAEVRGRGMLQAIELVRDRDTLESFAPEDKLAWTISAAGLANGAFFYVGGSPPAQDVICLGPPFTISDDELDLLVTALERSVDSALTHIGARTS